MAIPRNQQQQIQIARRQLGLTDDDYRALLARVAGVDSSKALTLKTAGAVRAEFERLGWKPKASPKTKGKPRNFNRMPEEITVIEAQLSDMGLTWAYADAIGKQMFGIPRVAWLREPRKVKALLAALHVEQDKRSKLEAVEHMCRQLEHVGVADPLDTIGLDQSNERWKRSVPKLKVVLEALAQQLAARGIH